MANSSNTKKDPNFRIKNKSLELKQEIINIASHKGLSYSAFLRSEIIKIRDATPPHLRIAPTDY